MFQITFPRAHNSLSLFHLLSIANGLVEQVIRLGGRGRCFCKAEAVVAETYGITEATIDTFLYPFTCKAQEGRRRCTIIVRALQGAPAPPSACIQRDEYICGRLTRTFLNSLPTDVFVVSTIPAASDLRPALCERVGEVRQRASLWEAAKAARINSRMVHVVWSKADADELSQPPMPGVPL